MVDLEELEEDIKLSRYEFNRVLQEWLLISQLVSGEISEDDFHAEWDMYHKCMFCEAYSRYQKRFYNVTCNKCPAYKYCDVDAPDYSSACEVFRECLDTPMAQIAVDAATEIVFAVFDYGVKLGYINA